jgi:hypothetical protein
MTAVREAIIARIIFKDFLLVRDGIAFALLFVVARKVLVTCRDFCLI